MFKLFRKEMEWGGTSLVLETGKVARQADGAVMVSLGETKVLCTAVAATVKAWSGLLSVDCKLSGKSLCRRKDSGGFSSVKVGPQKMKRWYAV